MNNHFTPHNCDKMLRLEQPLKGSTRMIKASYLIRLQKAAKMLVSWRILTGRCILCGGTSQNKVDLCNTCEYSLPTVNYACHHCALPIYSAPSNEFNPNLKDTISTTTICGQCQQSPPPFQFTIACWQYLTPLAQLISQYKHNHQLSYGMNLATLAGPLIRQQYLQHAETRTMPEALIATPLHWRRYWQRGFNQSQLLASSLSLQLDIPLINPLKRHQATTMQQSLNAKQRQHNLRNAFIVTKPDMIKGRRIALIDDVMTTGATATEAANTLINAGASEVHIWVLARTPR
jgi:ComF family protein